MTFDLKAVLVSALFGAAIGLLSPAAAEIATETAAAQAAQQAAMPPIWQPRDGAVIDFEVRRKGKRFGRHMVSFDRADSGELTVTSDVDLQVKIGPITAFRYRLDSVEQWRDGQLVSLNGTTNNDGDRTAVSASVSRGQLIVDSTVFDGALPLDTIPSSHWNIKQVFSPNMLSTEDGEVLPIEAETLGREMIQAGGQGVEATRYRLRSNLDVDLWYDDQGRWVKLAFEARGQTIEYVLTALY